MVVIFDDVCLFDITKMDQPFALEIEVG